MAKNNNLGISGIAYLRREDGSLTSNSVNVFAHIIEVIHKTDKEKIVIKFGLWNSKKEYKNEESELDILGKLEKKYIIDEETKIQRGRDVYDADGVERVFAFTNPNEGESYIQVLIGNNLQTNGEDYSISYDSGSSGTGNITFATAPEDGNKVKLIRLKNAYDIYFKDAKTKVEGENLTSRSLEFLKSLDGSDTWDLVRIDWTGYIDDID